MRMMSDGTGKEMKLREEYCIESPIAEVTNTCHNISTVKIRLSKQRK
jgi:hypothetical protein